MKITLPGVIRLFILIACVLAIYRLLPVIFRQWQGAEACPILMSIPACYLVFAGYIAIAVSVILAPIHTGWIFLAGWLPVSILALSGTLLELLVQPTCPRSAQEIPLCYFSLAIACILLVGFILVRKYSTASPVNAVTNSER